MKTIKLAMLILLGITAVEALAFLINSIVTLVNDPAMSAPWYAACLATLIFFGPVLLLEGGVYVLLRWWEKRKNGGKSV
ncbi:MAG: hypothetical protein ACI4F3_03625 [Enterocloster sp.]